MNFTVYLLLYCLGRIRDISRVSAINIKYSIDYEAFDTDAGILQATSWCVQYVVLQLPDNAVEITYDMYQRYERA
jgi:hypothetical protein